MRMPQTTASQSDEHRSHTMAGFFLIAVLFLLSLKPELLERLVDGSESLLTAVVKSIGGIWIF